MEKHVHFQSGALSLEGVYVPGTSDRGVVITHPHPLYGGDMHNLVVTAVAQAYNRCGFTTLRFNFRGVGSSTGAYAQGEGEQDDVRSALGYLLQMGCTTVDLAGYSFGSWVNAHAVFNSAITPRMIMVSPPAALMPFHPDLTLKTLDMVVTGDNDDIAPADALRTLVPHWNADAKLLVVEGADHFYGAQVQGLMQCVEEGLAGSG